MTDPSRPTDNGLKASGLHAIVLRFSDAVPEGLGGRSPGLAPDTVAAIYALVAMVDHLQTPGSGWPSDRPQTPEAIAPYVAEEIDRVLDLWPQPPPPSAWDRIGAIAPGWPSPHQDYYIDLEAWLSRLLWAVVRGSEQAMQWMEGVAAELAPGDNGRLRLVPCGCLILEEPLTFDLTTQQSPPALLPEETPVRSPHLSPEDTTIAHLLAQLRDHLETTTPRLQPLLAGLPVAVLHPGQSWEIGTMQLRLGVEFIPDPANQPAFTAPEAPGECAAHPQITLTSNVPSAETQGAPLNLRRDQGIDAILQTADAWRAIAQHPSDLAAWVRQSHEILAMLRHPAWEHQRTLVNQAWPLSHWRRCLLWHLSRSAYPVMQLLGGIAIHLLQPAQDWQAGTLRLWAGLRLRTDTQRYLVDVTTGQNTPAPHSLMSPGAIARPQASGWSPAVIPLGDLQETIIHELYQAVPLLNYLRSPVPVQVQGDDPQCLEPGTLQLEMQLEVLPRVDQA
jgi:hypothetical protein